MFTALFLIATTLIARPVDAWKVKISNAFGADYTCTVARVGSTNEWTTTVGGPRVTPFTVASFSQQPTACAFKMLGDSLVASMVVSGSDNGALTVRVLNSCNSGDAIRTATVCGVTTLMAGTTTASANDIASACGGAGKCGYNSTAYCETYACSAASSCGVFLSFASFSFPVTATKQSATCTSGSSPVFGPTTTITAVGTPSGSATVTDDSLSTCCVARGTATLGTGATTTAKPTTTGSTTGSTTGATTSASVVGSTTVTNVPCSTSCQPGTVFVEPCNCVPADSTSPTTGTAGSGPIGDASASTTGGAGSTTAAANNDEGGAAQLLLSAAAIALCLFVMIAH